MGNTKADPGTQPPVSPRRTAEVRQPDHAPDSIGGGMGLPQPVLPKGFGHTSDSASTTPRTIGGLTKGGLAQYSLADPFAGINPPPPEVLRESHSDQPTRGRAATHLEWPPEEKKRRSSSHPWGEADPKRGRSSGAEPLLGHLQSWRPAIRQGPFSTRK